MRGTLRAVLAGVVLAGLAAGCASTSTATTTKELELTISDEQATVRDIVDLGKEGFGYGDQLVERAPVVDGNGKTVGDSFTTIAVVDGTSDQDFSGLIDCSIVLEEGNILFHGSFETRDLGDGAALPVVGGTGDYAGVRGVVTMKVPDAKRSILTFDLLLLKAEE